MIETLDQLKEAVGENQLYGLDFSDFTWEAQADLTRLLEADSSVAQCILDALDNYTFNGQRYDSCAFGTVGKCLFPESGDDYQDFYKAARNLVGAESDTPQLVLERAVYPIVPIGYEISYSKPDDDNYPYLAEYGESRRREVRAFIVDWQSRHAQA